MQILSPKAARFAARLLSPFWFRLFLLIKLPMALIAGLRVRTINAEQATVTVPYKWLNQNPFNSTYFAVLSMAGEMATGSLGLLAIENAGHPISILVVEMHSEFHKKATDTATFTCSDGRKLFDAVEQTLQTGEPIRISTTSTGVNASGEMVARFVVTWSIKRKGG